MTKQENTGKRSLAFSSWIRQELPDSKTGFMETNQDWIFWNFKTRRLMFVEEKTHKGAISNWFHILIKDILHPAISQFAKKNDIDYRGYHLIQFENESPIDGIIKLDYRTITENELKEFLSMI